MIVPLATLLGLQLVAEAPRPPASRDLPAGRACRVDEAVAALPPIPSGAELALRWASDDLAELARADAAPTLFAASAEGRQQVVALASCAEVGPGSDGLFDAYVLGALHLAEGWQHLSRGEAEAALAHAEHMAASARAIGGVSLLGGMVGQTLEGHALELAEAALPAVPPADRRASIARLRALPQLSDADMLRNDAGVQASLVPNALAERWTWPLWLQAHGLPWPWGQVAIDPAGTLALADAVEASPLAPGDPVPPLSQAAGIARVYRDLLTGRAAYDARIAAL